MALKIQITGRHLELTPTLKQDVNKKFSILEKHFNHITDIHVTLSVERVQHKMQHTAKANINLPLNKDIHASCTSEDMYASIDMLIDKLDRQLVEYKEQMKS